MWICIYYTGRSMMSKVPKVLEKYYEQGLIKNIGVSNFRPKHLKQLEVTANIAPAVDQIEICPFLVQEETVNYCHNMILL